MEFGIFFFKLFVGADSKTALSPRQDQAPYFYIVRKTNMNGNYIATFFTKM